MVKKTKGAFIFLVVFSLLSFPFSTAALAQEELGEPSTFETLADAIVYRPLGLISIPVGFCVFVISLPFSFSGDNVSSSFNSLVVAPTKFTFNRPLGDI